MYANIFFLTTFDGISMLLIKLIFCESAPWVSRLFKRLILFVRFFIVFDFSLVERLGLFHDGVVSFYVTIVSLFFFTSSGNDINVCFSKQVVKGSLVLPSSYMKSYKISTVYTIANSPQSVLPTLRLFKSCHKIIVFYEWMAPFIMCDLCSFAGTIFIACWKC